MVNAEASNRGYLVHLEQHLASASSQVIRGRAQLREVRNAEKAPTVRLQIYRKATLEGVKRSIQVAESLWIGCLAEEDKRLNARLRVEFFAKSCISTRRQLEKGRADHASTKARCRVGKAEIQHLQTQPRATKQGSFVEDGSNEAPFPSASATG